MACKGFLTGRILKNYKDFTGPERFDKMFLILNKQRFDTPITNLIYRTRVLLTCSIQMLSKSSFRILRIQVMVPSLLFTEMKTIEI